MDGIKTARFVSSPRTLDDLIEQSALAPEQAYRVVHIETLSGIEYENFCCDMLADRQFLEEHAPECGDGEVWNCMLVRRLNGIDGVLVLPDRCYVSYAAYIPDVVRIPQFTREELEAMPTERLDGFLDDEFEAMVTTSDYIDFILLVLDVLEKREGRTPSPSLDAWFHDLLEQYFPKANQDSDNDN